MTKPTGKPKGHQRGQPLVRYKQLETPPKPVKPPRPLAKHERVTYTLPCDRSKNVVALIDRVHKDGTVTVNACYVLDQKGEREGGWLGYKYRINPTLLTRAA